MVVVSGIGIVSALGIGVDENLRHLRDGQSGIVEAHITSKRFRVPAGELQLTNDELKQRLGIDAKEIVSRTTLLGMLAAREAIASAALTDLSRVAFISSTTVGGMDLTPTFYKDYKTSGSGDLRYVAQHDCASSTMATREFCHLGGFYTAISTACSSSANAIMLGARMIEAGEADIVVAGGTDALCDYTFAGFHSLMLLSQKPCRPFDSERDGLNLGEGAAFLVLQREGEAKKTLARLSGYANANDAHHQTAMTAEGRGAQIAIKQALEKANLRPSDIDYINVHGTGTQNNDASELAAMTAIFDHVPPFSSTKTFTGHTLAAAGAIEAVFCLLGIEHNLLWPTHNFQSPIEGAKATPITELCSAEIHHAMSCSHGFGGNSTTLIFSKI